MLCPSIAGNKKSFHVLCHNACYILNNGIVLLGRQNRQSELSSLRNEIEYFLLWRVFHLLHCSDCIDSDKLIVSVVTGSCQGMTKVKSSVTKIQSDFNTEFLEVLRLASGSIISSETQRVHIEILCGICYKMGFIFYFIIQNICHVALIYEPICRLIPGYGFSLQHPKFYLHIARYWSNDLKLCTWLGKVFITSTDQHHKHWPVKAQSTLNQMFNVVFIVFIYSNFFLFCVFLLMYFI